MFCGKWLKAKAATPTCIMACFLFYAMAEKRKKHPWIKWKPYPHFGPKLGPADLGFVHSYITNPDNVEKHKFYPLIYRQAKERRYAVKPASDGTEKRCHSFSEHGKKKSTAKCREIFYASHLDAHILAYYANMVLGTKYETLLSTLPEVNRAVLAYRKIEKSNGSGKNNIDFAKEVFDLISEGLARQENVAAIALDISAFFDNLDHQVLLNAWRKLMGKGPTEKLEKDQYAVFKYVTNASYVRFEESYAAIGLKHAKQIRIKEPETFAKNQSEFRRVFAKRGKIHAHPFYKKDETGAKIRVGVPQGTPISAFLSNLYLLEFDKWACKLAKDMSAEYRRYSDDIVIVCKPEQVASVLTRFYSEIQQCCKLIIKAEKTQVTIFSDNRGVISSQCLKTGKQKPFQYLGFDFDGKSTLIKQASISKFYRKMNTAVRIRCSRVKRMRHTCKGTFQIKRPLKVELLKGPIYSRYSYQGMHGKNRNYHSYVALAARTMENSRIQKQLSGSWPALHAAINKRMNP